MARDHLDMLLEKMGLKAPPPAPAPAPGARRFTAEDFQTPDGGFDLEKFQTLDIPLEDAKRIRAERGFVRNKGSSGVSAPARKPIGRFALAPDAPRVDVRGLGGDEVQPVPEDVALGNLAEMKGGQQPRLLGQFDPDAEENRLPPKGAVRNAAGIVLPEQPLPAPRMLGKFDPDAPENRRPGQPPPTIRFAKTAPPQGSPEDFGNPFPDRQSQPDDSGLTAEPTVSPKLAALRAQAADAVGAMRSDTREHELDRDFGRVEKRVADMSAPKAALQRFQASRAPAPLPGPGDSGAERPRFDKPFTEMLAERERGPASPRQPLQAAQQMGMGATPPDTSKDEAEMDAASKKRDDELLLAQIASNFGHYSDVLGGSQTADRGASIRANAERALEDLKAKRGLRASARDAQTAAGDKAYERAGIDQTRAAAGAKTQREAEFNDATSPKSKQARQIATSLYPKLVARIPPADFQQMSAADIDTFLTEAAPEKLLGGHGTGVKPTSAGSMNTLRKSLPPHLVDTYQRMQDANSLVEQMGGWDKVKAGGFGAATPTVMLDKKNQALRQGISRVVAAFLQSGGGKAITDTERKILTEEIGADPRAFASSPEMLQRGLDIIQRSVANSARQGTAGASQADKDALFNDMGIDQDWVKGGELPKSPGVKPMRRPDKNGQLREKGADGRWHLVAP